MRKGMKKFAVMFLTIVMMIMNAMPAFAATGRFSAGGYSVPAAITVRVGEKTRFKVAEPSGKYANVSFQYTPDYVSTSGYSAGSYWGRPAEIIFTGKAPGTFTAIATVDAHRKAGDPDSSFAVYDLYCKVTVVKKGANTASSGKKKVALQKITLNKSSMSVKAGTTARLSVSYTPSNTTDSKTAVWSSSNTSVATVKNGTVTAKRAGSATITAKVGRRTATCKVTVKSASSGSSTVLRNTDSGTFKNVSKAYTVLNSFRTTKSNQWYWNEGNTAKTTVYGLKKLKKDAALEKTAKTRAKESWVMYYEKGWATHTRPNGSGWFTAYPVSLKYRGENLAWGHTTCNTVILNPTTGWAETNSAHSGQGHRRNMLDRHFTRVGIACYVKDGKTSWAMCLGG